MKPLKPLAKLLVEHVTALEMPMPKSIMCTHHGIGLGRVGQFAIGMTPTNFRGSNRPGLTITAYLERRCDPVTGEQITYGQAVFEIIRSEVRTIGTIVDEWNGPNDTDRPRACGISIVVDRELPHFSRAVSRYHWMGEQGRTFSPNASDKTTFAAFDRALRRNLARVKKSGLALGRASHLIHAAGANGSGVRVSVEVSTNGQPCLRSDRGGVRDGGDRSVPVRAAGADRLVGLPDGAGAAARTGADAALKNLARHADFCCSGAVMVYHRNRWQRGFNPEAVRPTNPRRPRAPTKTR